MSICLIWLEMQHYSEFFNVYNSMGEDGGKPAPYVREFNNYNLNADDFAMVRKR